MGNLLHQLHGAAWPRPFYRWETEAGRHWPKVTERSFSGRALPLFAPSELARMSVSLCVVPREPARAQPLAHKEKEEPPSPSSGLLGILA